jgi:hypothetical protein
MAETMTHAATTTPIGSSHDQSAFSINIATAIPVTAGASRVPYHRAGRMPHKNDDRYTSTRQSSDCHAAIVIDHANGLRKSATKTAYIEGGFSCD